MEAQGDSECDQQHKRICYLGVEQDGLSQVLRIHNRQPGEEGLRHVRLNYEEVSQGRDEDDDDDTQARRRRRWPREEAEDRTETYGDLSVCLSVWMGEEGLGGVEEWER